LITRLRGPTPNIIWYLLIFIFEKIREIYDVMVFYHEFHEL